MRALRIAFPIVAILACACTPTRLAVRATHYDVDAQLDPPAHRVAANVTIQLEQLDPLQQGRHKRRQQIELFLNADLELDSLVVEGATLDAHRQRAGKSKTGTDREPTRHRLLLRDATADLRITMNYHGLLQQDVAAGEKQGEIHNFSVSAHIAPEGVYLEPSGYWYPLLDRPDDEDPAWGLADFALTVAPLEGFEWVAGAERQADRADGAWVWSSPFPLDGLVLLGGPLERTSRMHHGVQLHAVLAPGKRDVGEDILDATADYLDQFQSLIGPYPFTEFTVLEAFFSSGFAFPTCTQIAGSQLSRYQQYRRHGYLDHELLHNWWGNGIFVDPRDGNWCEGLASYMGNYYGFVLDEDEEGARKQRRNQSNFLSAIESQRDKPLDTFGLEGGAGGGIGYQKAASVFHMLERKIGREALFAGLRRLTSEQIGRHASWQDLQDAFQRETDVDLGRFFQQWVRSGGAPLLELQGATHLAGEETVTVTIAQGSTNFALDVPLRLHYGERSADTVVSVEAGLTTVTLPCEPDGLTAVELDPDYHLFRRLKRDEIMPTSSLTRRAEQLLILIPDGELAEGYQVLIDSFTDAILGDGKDGHRVDLRKPSEVTAHELSASSVLILGDAVRNPIVLNLLVGTRNPVVWGERSFSIKDVEYASARQAVFLTVHHPTAADQGITVYTGNSAEALSNARVLEYYANSLLVFDTPAGSNAVDSEDASPRAEVMRRIDFEFHDRIEF